MLLYLSSLTSSSDDASIAYAQASSGAIKCKYCDETATDTEVGIDLLLFGSVADTNVYPIYRLC